MKQGLCKLCYQLRALCNSHAIPDATFKHVFRQGSGKAVVALDDAKTPIRYSSDSWDVAMLCSDCEGKLNTQYDSYGIAIFHGSLGQMKEMKDGISFKGIDRQRLRMFFLSILWRSSVSWHESYGNIDLPTELESQLRDALATDTKLPASVLNVAVYKLKDSSPPNGFSDEHIRSLVVAPFARKFTLIKVFHTMASV